jgi:Primase C terminal 2 (PriCT-2)
MPSPIRSLSVFMALPRPSWAEAHAASAERASERQLPSEVLKAFATVPDHIKAKGGSNEFGAGIDPTPGAYVPKLPMTEAQLDACLNAMPNTNTAWDEWNSIGMEIYAETDGADYGLAAWERWSAKNPLYAQGDTGCAQRWGQYATSPPTRTGGGALVNKARAALNDRKWKPPPSAVNPPPAVTTEVTGPDQRKPLKGGEYGRAEALELTNSHYLVGKTAEEIASRSHLRSSWVF